MFPEYVEEVFSSPPGIIILEYLDNPWDAHNLLKINLFLRLSLNLFIRKYDYSFTLNFLDNMWKWHKDSTLTYTHYDKELKEKFSQNQLENELSKVWLFDFMVFRALKRRSRNLMLDNKGILPSPVATTPMNSIQFK